MKNSVAAALVLIVSFLIAPDANAQSRRSAKAPDEAVVQRVNAALDALEADGDTEQASAVLDSVFAQVIAWGAENEPQTLREVAFARRLVELVGAAEEDRAALLPFLRDRPTFAGDLVFLIDDRSDHLGAAGSLALRLGQTGPDKFEELAPLVAAICVVHDEPVRRRFNENIVESPDAAALYAYYAANANRLYFDTADFPPELYTHVVDATPAIDDMTWALDRYARHNDVGGLFRTIRYDHESLLGGREKNVTKEGYTLPNILRFGGVCVDQAYFAVMVGKSIGVPTAYVRAAAAEGGHAWVGFLQRSGKGALWNFDTGRYDAYKGLKGRVIDPQSGDETSDAEITLAAGLITYTREERQQAIAYIDAAEWLLDIARRRAAWPPENANADAAKPRTRSTARKAAPTARAADAAGVLALLESSIDACPYQLQSWRLVGDTAQRLGVTPAQRRVWIDAVERLCGSAYPDFTITVLRPVIESLDDPREKDRMWESLLKLCHQRPDLAAEVLVEQGRVWANTGDLETALQCFRQVLDRHTEDGPFVLNALMLADGLLTAADRAQESLRLYQTTWGRCKKPETNAYYRAGSNWFQIGTMYAARLHAAGDHTEAQRILDTLKR